MLTIKWAGDTVLMQTECTVMARRFKLRQPRYVKVPCAECGHLVKVRPDQAHSRVYCGPCALGGFGQ